MRIKPPIKFELTPKQWEDLVLAISFAAGAASRSGGKGYTYRFLNLYETLALQADTQILADPDED